MPFRSRIYLAAVLLPLLISTWSGWMVLGGWHCADGSQCRPAAASACCCEEPSQTLSGSVKAEEDDCAHAGINAGCGCYYDTPTLEAELRPTAAYPQLFAALPHPVHYFDPRVVSTPVDHLPSPTYDPPPVFRSSPVTRGPPVI